MHIKKHFLSHKERLRKKIIHIKTRILLRHQKAEQKIKNMVAHKFFYPILISSISIISIITIGTYASTDTNILDTNCVNFHLDENKIKNQETIECSKYKDIQSKVDKVLPIFFLKLKRTYGDNYGKYLLGLLDTLKEFDNKEKTEKKQFLINYLYFEIKKKYTNLKTLKKIIITSLNHYGYGYGYVSKVVSKGKPFNIGNFNLINKTDKKIILPYFIIQNTDDESFVSIKDITNIKLKVKYQNKYLKKEFKGVIDKYNGIVVFPCDIYLLSKGNYEFSIFGTINDTTTKNKLRLTFSKKTKFKDEGKNITKSEMLEIKGYDYYIVK